MLEDFLPVCQSVMQKRLNFMKQKTIKTIELVNFLHHLINEKKLLISNQSIVLAVSGGQDSICLFFIFLQLKTQWGWNFSLVYCNHLWQKDSFYTMLHLFKLAYLLNVPVYFTITLQKILSEQKARNWRSLTFQRITQFYFFSVIVTGHSKSDQIETGLFNIFRGSGTKGVSSLNWIKVVNKRCFFKLNRIQLKDLKNLYQTETNPNILLTSLLDAKQDTPNIASCYGVTKAELLSAPKKQIFFEDVRCRHNILISGLTSEAPPDIPQGCQGCLLTFRNVKKAMLKGDISTRDVISKSPKKMSSVTDIIKSNVRKRSPKRSLKFVRIKQEEIEIFPPYKTEYTLVRPFLSLPRFDLKKLCISWKIPLFPDQSNQKVKYQRNRIRKQLLPTLRFFFNPQIDTVLYQFIDIIKNEEEYISFITARIVKQIEQKKEKSVELETSLFAVLPIAIRRKILKHFLNNIMKKSLTFFDVEKFLKQISISKSVKPQKSFLKKQDKGNKSIFKNFVWNPSNPPLTYCKTKVVNRQLIPSNILTSCVYKEKQSLDKTLINRRFVSGSGRVRFRRNVNQMPDVRGITESLFVKGNPTEKKILRVYFPHQTSYKSKICIIKHDSADIPDKPEVCQGCQLNHENFSIPFAQLKKQTNKIIEKKTFVSFPLKKKNLPLQTSPLVMSANQRRVVPATQSGAYKSILQKDILFNLINKKKSIYKEYKLMFFPKTGSLFLEAQRLFFIKNKQNLFSVPCP